MTEITVREADLGGADALVVGRLIGAYLLQTEHEKFVHLGGRAALLSVAQQSEVANPRRAYADGRVPLAEIDGVAQGVVVVRTRNAELKRFWTQPEARGRGVGARLLDAAITLCHAPARLSVWEWRAPAIRLYESRGFARVATWEEREGLVCMIRSSD